MVGLLSAVPNHFAGGLAPVSGDSNQQDVRLQAGGERLSLSVLVPSP